MLTPDTVGRLRQAGLWSVGQRAHGLLAPPLCSAIHAVVRSTGRLAPLDLALKHTYDYQTVPVETALITRALKVGEWHRMDPSQPQGRLARLRRWYELGGGWKNASRHVSRNMHGRFIADGDWDMRTRPVETREVITDLFVHGRPPHETAEYAKLLAWIEAGRFGWTRGCRTREDLDRYFAELIGTYESISQHGYRTQTELGYDGSDEIRICVDRAGYPCVFGGGTHRLSIARVLRLPRVPVLVKRVHAKWVVDCVERAGGEDEAEAILTGLEQLAATSTAGDVDG